MTKNKVKREIRRAQTIAPFGVGAIFDYKDESFIGMDVSRWSQRGRKLICTRLSRSLGGFELYEAPDEGPAYTRFPRWLVCRTCQRLERWSRPKTAGLKEDTEPRCSAAGCQGRLIPMRFVMVCKDSHLSDIPWDRWVHLDHSTPAQRNCTNPELYFKAQRGAGGGLASLTVSCRKCQASRSLDKLMGPKGLSGIACTGRQPWQRFDKDTSCRQPLEVVQRGATNLYDPNVMPAIDIPPESDYDPRSALAERIRTHEDFPTMKRKALQEGPDSMMAKHLIEGIILDLINPEDETNPAERESIRREILNVVHELDGNVMVSGTDEDPDLLIGEWHALTTRSTRTPHRRDNFQTEHTQLLQSGQDAPPGSALEELNRIIGSVVLVRRLREVRALRSFTRLGQPSVIDVGAPGRPPPFLPAIEVFGEGIFFTVREEVLAGWEERQKPFIESRVGIVRKRRDRSQLAEEYQATPRFIALHTLSHLLIRQLAFEAGYSSTSLRERLYIAEPDGLGRGGMAGILIYTAAGDQEGTLGGLVRLGEPPALSRTLLNALAAAQWCSGDPVCRESSGQGLHGLNRAACHACALASETSCTHRNLLLDRELLLGSAGSSSEGLFSEVLRRSLIAPEAPDETA